MSEVASRLGFEVRYLAACDAAYSSESDPRRSLGFQAKQSDAFFQTLTNQFKQEFHGKQSAIKTFQDFSNDPEFKSANHARVAKLAALAAVPGGVLAQGRVHQDFITVVHSMAVKKGNDIAFRNAKAALNAP